MAIWRIGDRKQVAVVRELFHLRLEGMGYRTIANDLNRRHVESPSGGKWSHDAVRLILIRETYCGTLTLGGRKQGKYFTTDNEQVTAVSGNQPRRTTPVRVEGGAPGHHQPQAI